MRPAPGELLHFSEDGGIDRFEPHVAATAQQPDAYVWAVDWARAPDYWFPRDCPRVLAWKTDTTSAIDRERILGAGVRVHAIEYCWLEAMQTVELFAYRFAVDAFESFGDDGHAFVATTVVEPLGPAVPIGNLLDLHEAAGIELRVLTNLHDLWDAVRASTLGFSGIRLANAKPRATT